MLGNLDVSVWCPCLLGQKLHCQFFRILNIVQKLWLMTMDNYALEAQDCKKTVPWLCQLKILSKTMVFVRKTHSLGIPGVGNFEPCWVPPVWSINLNTPTRWKFHLSILITQLSTPQKKSPMLTWLLPSVGTPCWVFLCDMKRPPKPLIKSRPEPRRVPPFASRR